MINLGEAFPEFDGFRLKKFGTTWHDDSSGKGQRK